ncbi:MAG: CDP-glucose 4,6-dehydratase [Planctomycetota bacterium]
MKIKAIEMQFKSGKFFKDKPILVTGHTGFKGSWLSIWLNELGAKVIGFSLPEMPSDPCLFQNCDLKNRIIDLRGDIRENDSLKKIVEEYKPVLIFHLAAQSLVLRSYSHPKETFDTNAGGTVNLLEAVRGAESVKAVVCITTDKCYENREWIWGYRENDRLGGHDPYSASKAMAEMAIHSYRNSFFSTGGSVPAIASTRAGNVIGGGDFAENRLVPDCVRALMKNKEIPLRRPDSIRPWQFVLEPLSGYLWLALKLMTDGREFAEAWNFGPIENKGISAREVVSRAIELWGCGSYKDLSSQQDKTESNLLRLNSDKAGNRLHWKPAYALETAFSMTISWYKEYHRQTMNKNDAEMYSFTVKQIDQYLGEAKRQGIEWAL